MTSAPVPSSSQVRPPNALGAALSRLWHLDPTIAFLNHGSFGACPRRVLDAQTSLRHELEQRPIEFMDRRRPALIAEARRHVGAFVGASPDNFGFVTNATAGVNAVLRSIDWRPGDELVTTTHVYPAVRQTMRYLAERYGAVAIEAPIELPVTTPDRIVASIESQLNAHTRIVIIDHITSPSALIFPVADIVPMCAERDIDVLIDGAHAPGMIELDIESIGAAYYAANLHKWVCAPKGAAILWARPDRQVGIHPAVLSHFVNEGFTQEFDMQGTRDITSWLSAPAAIEFLEQFGWDRVRAHNHQMAVWAHTMLCERWDVVPISPPDGSMLGSMAAAPLPKVVRDQFETGASLQAHLYDQHQIEAPVIDWLGGPNNTAREWMIRVSCQIYNSVTEYEKLADAVAGLMRR